MKPPEPLTFFLDRSLGKYTVADALLAAGARVEVHDDHFAPDAKDQEWLRQVGVKRWIVLTKDRRFHHRALEISALASTDVRVFKLTAANLQASEMGAIFARALNKMSHVVAGNRGPFIATLSRSGRISVVLTAGKLRKYK